MRKLVVSTLMTLDGVVQDPGGFGETPRGGWANPYFDEEAESDSYERLIESEYFLCGRVTYELLSSAWGNINEGAYLKRMNAIPKLVASTTLQEPLQWNSALIKGDVAQEIAKLKQQPGGNIEMYGSTTLMQTLMRHDLVDEYLIWVHPLVLGSGKRLFPESGQGAKLRLTNTRARSSGVVGLMFEPERKAPATARAEPGGLEL
jgi:dihydrofolate reductase